MAVQIHSSSPWQKMEMYGQFHAPAALPSGNQWLAGWVRPTVGFNAVEKGNTSGLTTNTVPQHLSCPARSVVTTTN